MTAHGDAGFHLVLDQPEIPQNTGNIIRLAACTGATLHLVEPLGFRMEDRYLRRAGLDYRDAADVRIHPDFDACLAALPSARVFAFTGSASVSYADVGYALGDVLLFGRESQGLATHVLGHARITERVRIPMLPERRSLNLANSVGIAVYEAWRQQRFIGGRP